MRYTETNRLDYEAYMQVIKHGSYYYNKPH